MLYRELGKTTLQVSAIGFGTWGLGGTAYGPVSDADSIITLHKALELGINFYDTSDLYGDGRSEEVLGKAFRDRRSNVIITSKTGMLPHNTFDMLQDFSVAHMHKSLEKSLQRLGTDYIDLYQLHSPELNLPNWDDVMAALDSMKQSGKIRHYGLSARSPSDALLLLTRFDFASVQVNYNMIDQRALDIHLFDRCRERCVGVIARTPLSFGYLSGKMTGLEEFPSSDHRSRWPIEQRQRWAKAPALFAKLNEGKQRTISQLALQYCIAEKTPVATVIPGMMNPLHVEDNASILSLPDLTKEECATIREVYLNNNFYDPKAKSSPMPAATSANGALPSSGTSLS